MNITAPPHDGINEWVINAGWQARKQGATIEQAITALKRFEPGMRRPFKSGEVERALRKVYDAHLPQKDRQPPKPAVWSPVMSRQAFDRSGITLADLDDMSPYNGFDIPTGDLLRDLFPDPEGLVCIGRGVGKFDTRLISEFKSLANAELVVAAYMTKRRGTTLEGRTSAHAKSNTGERRFCVCDFDKPDPEYHAAITYQLMRTYKLVLTLTSGGKSLHSWFAVEPTEQKNFWRLAIRLGADPALERNRSQFVRLPNGRRSSNGKKQAVFYYNPTHIPTS